jgi:hypothetical protein
MEEIEPNLEQDECPDCTREKNEYDYHEPTLLQQEIRDAVSEAVNDALIDEMYRSE